MPQMDDDISFPNPVAGQRIGPTKNDDGLTHKEFLFCEAYLKSGNARESYFQVYSKTSPESNNSWRLLKKPKINAYIRKRLMQKEHTLDVIMDVAYKRLRKIIESSDDQNAAIKAAELMMRMKECLETSKNATPKSDNQQITLVVQEIKKPE